MDLTRLLPLLPTMPLIQEELTLSGWACHSEIQDPNQTYQGIRLYHGQSNLQSDVLYLLRPTETHFPTNRFSYISTVPIPGQANHFFCPDHPDEEILDLVLDLFFRFQFWRQSLDQLTYRRGSLQELCELGEQLLDNPVCIHDDWFIMSAHSPGVQQIMAPEYVFSSTRGFIPRAILDDFQHDSEYLETYSYRSAQIWKQPNSNQTSLYVNLWDGAVYRGRLLVLQQNRPFRQSDFLLAEVLTQRALFLLNQKQPGDHDQARSMDDIIFDLLQHRSMDPSEQSLLLNMLGWNKASRFLCVRVKSQQPDTPALMDHALHSDLFQTFPGSYILFTGREQCLLLNLTRQPIAIPQVRHRLAPLCRDYCLYVGISSPVNYISELHIAYHQAEIALNRAFQLRSEKWIIPFQDCVLEHLASHLESPLLPAHLVSPELLQLKEYDDTNGTQFFETLKTYLLLERDIPKTAQALIVHRTTLLYRLKKIQQLVNLNLEDPDHRLYLLFSLWLLNRKQAEQ